MLDIAHIHPMLVHFPLVLIPIAVCIDWVAIIQGKDLASRHGIPMVSTSAWVLGGLMAIAAAIFGDIAFDAALDKGFAKSLLENHEEIASTALWVILALVAVRLLAIWRSFTLSGGRGVVTGLAGLGAVGILLSAAYFGGNLVYLHGVNVAPHP